MTAAHVSISRPPTSPSGQKCSWGTHVQILKSLLSTFRNALRLIWYRSIASPIPLSRPQSSEDTGPQNNLEIPFQMIEPNGRRQVLGRFFILLEVNTASDLHGAR